MKNIRKWGKPPFKVAVIHGGPGAPGEMAPVARELAKAVGVLEPLQTKGSLEGQVQELRDVLKQNGNLPVVLVGWSHGATLGYILSARYPALIEKLVIVGAPSFEEKYMADILSDRLNRLTEEERAEVFNLEKCIWDRAEEDKNVSLKRLFQLYAKADSYDPLPHKDELLEIQLDVNISVGLETHKVLASGELLEMGKQITCPVVAIHGDYDTHLPEGVREPLARVLKDFRFILLEKCGHEPWLERYARDNFFKILKKEILF
jgi:pimeloyl-ACP methyl ester carboxylesterase